MYAPIHRLPGAKEEMPALCPQVNTRRANACLLLFCTANRSGGTPKMGADVGAAGSKKIPRIARRQFYTAI